MLILVLNCGSSSVKYKLYNMENETVLLSGLAERIGLSGARLVQKAAGQEKVTWEMRLADHRTAVEAILRRMGDAGLGVRGEDIAAVGHRVVHGGEAFAASTVVDDAVLQKLEELSQLAPLHNPPNVTGIKICRQLLPHALQVAVFDTAFHQTMPPKAYMYALPYEYYRKYGLRKYGFHGTSHRYVAQRAAQMLGRPLDELKLITCHLGNGSSLCAVKEGRAVDTTMGFTPLSGLVMGTRCGDIDPAVVALLIEKEGLTPGRVSDLLNKQSGVLGVSGLSSDFRDLEQAATAGNRQAQLALDMFVYSVQKWVGAFAAAMGGVDAIVFTAGIGENSPYVRRQVLDGLTWLGLRLDERANCTRGRDAWLTTPDSEVQALVVPTDEELVIARDAAGLLAEHTLMENISITA
ncbi:acetate/propionate family kinase [Desulfurispora thermophila]|uniref:acetate/propionate family kinase n=1 Tax=Desulfurispora thermophila TaxID=265470 RepID=UPI000372F2F5|nr:acetate kinase [Desulfurispora thermophila]